MDRYNEPIEIYLKFDQEPFSKQADRQAILQDRTGKQYIHHYQPQDIINAQDKLKWLARQQVGPNFKPFDGPVFIEYLVFRFKPLKSMTKKEKMIIAGGGYIPKCTKPDLTDNLQKGLFDALQGIIYLNDSQIWATAYVKKIYCRQSEIEIKITGTYK